MKTQGQTYIIVPERLQNGRLDTKNSRMCHIDGDLWVKICLSFTSGSVYPKY